MDTVALLIQRRNFCTFRGAEGNFAQLRGVYLASSLVQTLPSSALSC